MMLPSIPELGSNALSHIREMKGFPFRTGHLKWDATRMELTAKGFQIVFDTTVANYIDFLECGTRPHLIPNAFGRGITVQHPGSTKHKDFIKKKAVQTVVYYLAEELNAKAVMKIG